MTSEELLNTLASTAVKADALDLDLIDSGKRLSALMSLFITEILSRMEGEDTRDNGNMLQFLMDSAVKANSDRLEASREEYLICRKSILEKIPKEAQQKELLAVSVS